MLALDGSRNENASLPLNREDAMDCSRWRKRIGMIHDHDECEWVNVSSGTGSSGFSRTNSTELQNSCVCVLKNSALCLGYLCRLIAQEGWDETGTRNEPCLVG